MKTRQEEMAEQCQAFHDEHPEVWRLFVKFTNNVIAAGFKNYSANAVFEVRAHSKLCRAMYRLPKDRLESLSN